MRALKGRFDTRLECKKDILGKGTLLKESPFLISFLSAILYNFHILLIGNHDEI